MARVEERPVNLKCFFQERAFAERITLKFKGNSFNLNLIFYFICVLVLIIIHLLHISCILQLICPCMLIRIYQHVLTIVDHLKQVLLKLNPAAWLPINYY